MKLKQNIQQVLELQKKYKSTHTEFQAFKKTLIDKKLLENSPLQLIRVFVELNSNFGNTLLSNNGLIAATRITQRKTQKTQSIVYLCKPISTTQTIRDSKAEFNCFLIQHENGINVTNPNPFRPFQISMFLPIKP